MHHLYPSLKGDQLCPLGFHPQTRYPTRCKRCFRDYKEHCGKRGLEDVAASSPNISDGLSSKPSRSWTSTQNLFPTNGNGSNNDVELKKRPQSWSSTPDIDNANDQAVGGVRNQGTTVYPENNNVDVTVKLPGTSRRHTTTLDIKEVENSLSQNRTTTTSTSPSPKPSPSPTRSIPDDLVILSTDSLAERVRKMNLLKKQRSLTRESSRERSVPKKSDDEAETKAPPDRPERSKPSSTTSSESNKRPNLPPKKTTTSSSTTSKESSSRSSAATETTKSTTRTLTNSNATTNNVGSNSNNYNYSTNNSAPTSNIPELSSSPNSLSLSKEASMQRKSPLKEMKLKANDHYTSSSNSSSSTMQNSNSRVSGPDSKALQDEIKTLRNSLEEMRARAERAERDKSDILLRRLASMETAPNRTAASEALMLQKKVNEMSEQIEKMKEEKRRLNIRMKELENNPKSAENELRRKLQAAEQLCEELMEENQEAKKEIVNLQAEMEEVQDSFRDDEMKAQTNLQRDLEKTTKNCRILSFKLKKCERKIEQLEQEKENNCNQEMSQKVKKLEEELRFSNDLIRKLQAEAEDLGKTGKKRPPMLGVIGKSTSADAKITRESLTRGGSQEDPQQLLRDLQDSIERESDLKDQLKFAEEEAESLRNKLARFEDENDSLMMQLKKMAKRSKPTTYSSRDDEVSDDDDAAELRVLLELNEQEASKLRHRVEELEKENRDNRMQVKELQSKLQQEKKSLLSNSTSSSTDKKLKVLNDELLQLRITVAERERTIEKLQVELATRAGKAVNSNEEFNKLKQSLGNVERERDELNKKLSRILQESKAQFPLRSPKLITDLTPKNNLKKWIKELEDELDETRAMVVASGGLRLQALEKDKKLLLDELQHYKEDLSAAKEEIKKLESTSTPKLGNLEKKLKKTEEEAKSLYAKNKEMEDKIKKQENQLKALDSLNSSLEAHAKREKEKYTSLEKDYEKERKEREKLETKLTQATNELIAAQKTFDKTKKALEKEIKELKSNLSSKSENERTTELRKQIADLQEQLMVEKKHYKDLNSQWEKLSEETILTRAQLTTEKDNLQAEINSMRQKLAAADATRADNVELARKLNDAQKKIQELNAKIQRHSSAEYEKAMLKNKLTEKEQEYDRLRRENEMNIDLVFQLRKDVDDLNKKLNDFSRIEQAQSSLNGHSANLETEIKSLNAKLKNAELQLKSEVAATRLRYEQQVKNLSAELTSMQRQCEKFKKDRDSFKQMLESAQKKIGDLKASSTGRHSRSSIHSSDDDDKSKIAYLEQQVGKLEDQLVEARLETSKVKTELVSERSANVIKISEMQSKLNEFEEERVIGSGRTKIPGMKTKLELSWQKEREEQQRLLQETSTLARDLRQTLFEVERERDKERLESKRRLEQQKRTTEEEMEESRRKIAELQCDLLELRDVHAKLRTSNEKLRRERERYEKEIMKRRTDQDNGDRRINALLQTVDELIKIAPDIKMSMAEAGKSGASTNKLRPEQPSPRRNRSPSPSAENSEVSNIITRLAQVSEELRTIQRINEEESDRTRIRRSNLRRAASQENDPHGSQSSVASAAGTNRGSSRLTRSGTNGSLIRKSLSLDQTNQQNQKIWRQDDDSMSSMQSIDSELGGLVRDSSVDSRLDSRLSGGSTQSDILRGPRKRKKGLIGKLRSLTKSGRNSESEVSVQGSDSDISVASDMRSSKKDLRGRLSGMFKRSGSTSRSESTERTGQDQRPVAVTVVGDENGPQPREPPPANASTPKPIRSIARPPAPTTPQTKRRVAK